MKKLLILSILSLAFCGWLFADTPQQEWQTEMASCTKSLNEAKTDAEKIVILSYMAQLGAKYVEKGLPLSSYQRGLKSGAAWTGSDSIFREVGTVEQILK